MITTLFLMMAILAGQAGAQYPPLREYMMGRDAEIALAKSAAPANISDHATVKVLTASGYEVDHQGNNGFVCIVMRGWAAPTYTPAQFRNLVYDATVRAPICFDPAASRTVMPYYELVQPSNFQVMNSSAIVMLFFGELPATSAKYETNFCIEFASVFRPGGLLVH